MFLRTLTAFFFLLSSALPGLTFAASMPDVDVFGWLHVEYGRSSAPTIAGDANGKDRLGIRQSALGAKGTKGHYSGVIMMGADTFNGDVGKRYSIKDAFLVYNRKKDLHFKVSAGAQPILFGLKPNGFPGDRSVRAGLEYGGNGGYNFAFQGLTSVKFDYFIHKFELNAVVFDTDESATNQNDGSSVEKNVMLQARFKDLFTKGFYGNFGYEGRYVGAVDKSKAIMSGGLGYDHRYFDLSLEYVTLEKEFTSTPTKEKVMVVELTGKFSKKWMGYIDYANASEADLTTTRYGIKYAMVDYSSLQLEYGQDKRPGLKSDSVDLRWALMF